MKRQDCEQLTLFPEDSHASHSPLTGSVTARKMTVTSGLKCLESYENSSPLGSLVKMCLGSSIWHSTRCYLTWKRKDLKPNVSLFRLAVSMPRTKENEPALWPTPSTGAALCGGTGNLKTLRAMEKAGIITKVELRNLSQGNGGKTNPQLLEWLMGYEQRFTELIPTPRASDYKGPPLNRYWVPNSQTVHVERERERSEYRGQLVELVELTPWGKIGHLNPEWTEWLMGYPIGWTELNASETPLSRNNSTPSSNG